MNALDLARRGVAEKALNCKKRGDLQGLAKKEGVHPATLYSWIRLFFPEERLRRAEARKEEKAKRKANGHNHPSATVLDERLAQLEKLADRLDTALKWFETSLAYFDKGMSKK